jgi:alkylation response protein AidB-like acyl-CoA dehydrogenase
MNELQLQLKDQINKYCLAHIEPFMEEDDENAHFRREIFTGLGELGLAGITLPDTYGGSGLGLADQIITLEEVSRYSVAYAVTLSVSTMVQTIINEFGNEDQKKKYLPELTSGAEIGCFCLSEAGSGSDAASLMTSAKKTDKGYILNGTKLWISSAGEASTYIVMARTGGEGAKGVSAFIVEKDTEGMDFGKKEKKMGWRASPTREVIFENCLIPSENLIGKEGEGFKVAMNALNKGRITIGAIAVGLARRSLDEAINYTKTRKQFNQALYDFQGLQWMIADLATDLEAAALLVEKAAQLYDANQSDIKLAAMAKMRATDMVMKLTTDAVQLHGGVGYTKEYPVERYMRDAKVLQIVEGTNQIQKLVIARELSKEYQ